MAPSAEARGEFRRFPWAAAQAGVIYDQISLYAAVNADICRFLTAGGPQSLEAWFEMSEFAPPPRRHRATI
jgi:hypothetical protein